MQDNSIIWIPVFEYENLYEVSNTGLVRTVRFKTEPKILKHRINKQTKYAYLILYKNKTPQTKTIHRLVLQSFMPNKNEKKLYCNHKNGNRSDNNLYNLEWVTRSENMKHAYHVLGNTPHTKGKCGKDAIRNIAIQQIDQFTGQIIEEFYSLTQAVEKGFSLKSISNVINGRSKTHKNYIWRKV